MFMAVAKASLGIRNMPVNLPFLDIDSSSQFSWLDAIVMCHPQHAQLIPHV
jgi:hypothetical protein